jgi:hypothetical protein
MCGTRRCRSRLGRGHDAYLHNFVICEPADEGGPDIAADRDCLVLVLVAELDADLQTDPVAFDVCEPREGLDGEIDGSLDESVNQ